MHSKFLALAGAAVLVAGVGADARAGETLDAVKAKGFLQCAVSTGLAGFSYTTADGDWPCFGFC